MDTITVFAPEMIVAGGDPRGESYRYYSLDTGRRLMMSEAEAMESGAWDIAFKRSIIKINGGPGGPGGMEGCCIAEPFELSREDFLRLTDGDLERTFEEAALTGNETFRPEGVIPAITRWYTKDEKGVKHNAIKSWKLRLADETGFARMRFKDVADDLRSAVIEYAVQEEKDGPLSDDRTGTLEEGKGFSFKEGKAVPAEGKGWDIKLEEGEIYLNSSVSGPGAAGAIGSNIWGAKWSEFKNPSDSVAYFMDELGQIFRHPKWYRYNIDGKHNLHPNGAVYGLRKGDVVYKVQVFDYFTHKGSDIGNFRLRCARL